MLLGYVPIDRGRLDVFVTKQDLDRPQVSTGFKQMCGIAVAEDIPVLLMICTPRKSATAITRVMEWQSN